MLDASVLGTCVLVLHITTKSSMSNSRSVYMCSCLRQAFFAQEPKHLQVIILGDNLGAAGVGTLVRFRNPATVPLLCVTSTRLGARTMVRPLTASVRARTRLMMKVLASPYLLDSGMVLHSRMQPSRNMTS